MASIAPNTTIASTRWITPSPLWNVPDTALTRPFVTEFNSDRFMAQFLDMVAGRTPLALQAPQDTIKQPSIQTSADVFKLYQPIHQRYYLAIGSLVCRQLGLPDHTVTYKNGEKTSLVLRRITQVSVPQANGTTSTQDVELAWVNDGPNKGWKPLLDENNQPVALRNDEERLPVYQTKVIPPSTLSNSRQRTNRAINLVVEDPRIIYHGYIPVSRREKYLTPPQASEITQALQSLQDKHIDPRLDEIATRVIEPWHDLVHPSSNRLDLNATQDENKVDLSAGEIARRQDILTQTSLYMLLDLANFLQNNLPDIFNTLLHPDRIAPPTDSEQSQLLTTLNHLQLRASFSTQPVSVSDAISRLIPSLPLLQGQDIQPNDTYDLSKPQLSGSLFPLAANYFDLPSLTNNMQGGTLYQLFQAALKTEGSPIQVPPELVSAMKAEPDQGDVYCVRFVYEHAPCDPVISEPSPFFTFAKVFDPLAPARPIRIELPSIKLKDLRNYKRGVGMQTSSDLNDLINRVNTGMLKGGGLLDQGASLGIAFICSFSIPIITICAFIVMYIFLMLLNFIFWWLPFIRICFPIPRRK